MAALTGFNRPGSGEPDLVPGEIVVYRMFRGRIGFRSAYSARLYSLSSPYSWSDGDLHEATCIHYQHLVALTQQRTYRRRDFEDLVAEAAKVHRAPELECTCGFYAYYSPLAARHYVKEWEKATGMGDEAADMVLAAVACSGRIVLGTRGVRAERMRILAISTEQCSFELQTSLEWSLSGVEKYVADADLLARHVPPDPTTLVPDADLRTDAYENMRAQLAVACAASVAMFVLSGVLGIIISHVFPPPLALVVNVIVGMATGYVLIRRFAAFSSQRVSRRAKRRALADFRKRYVHPG